MTEIVVILVVIVTIVFGVIYWYEKRYGPLLAARQFLCLHDGGMLKVETGGNLRLESTQLAVQWRCWDGMPGVTSIHIDAGEQFQEIDGFGGAFTDAACYMFNLMDGDSRHLLFADLFATDGLGLNFCRVCMGASDYATHAYSYCDSAEPDPQLKKFSIEHDKKYILPALREAMALNADALFFASPWSPPGWMKANGSMLGGNMQRIYFSSYAQYFVRFIQGYAEEGIKIHAVTVQNEVDTDQDGKMPACAWPQEYEVDFVRHHLGPGFVKAGIGTKIWIIDHNYNLWGRALGSLDTPSLAKFVSAIAWHGYVGDAWRIDTVHDAYPEVGHYWTEGGPDYTNADYGTDWLKWARTFTTNLRHWCRGITVWNLALDEKGRPNIGPFPCGGLVTINSQSKEVSYSGQYYALGQFSKHINRGSKRIGSGGEIANLLHVAFLRPDGKRVLVLTNFGEEITVKLVESNQVAEITLARESVTTLVWQ
jgi:glucosylceramidase